MDYFESVSAQEGGGSTEIWPFFKKMSRGACVAGGLGRGDGLLEVESWVVSLFVAGWFGSLLAAGGGHRAAGIGRLASGGGLDGLR